MQTMNFTEVLACYRNGEMFFSDIDMQNANMTNLDMRGVTFKNSDLSGTNFAGSDLTDSNFIDCNLSRCLFDGCILKNTNFEGSNMTRASIRNVTIERTSFRKVNFMWAHLCGNDLVRADITDAILDWSCLIGSRVTDEQASGIPEHALLTRTGSHNIQYESAYEKIKIAGYGQVQMGKGYGQIQQSGQAYGQGLPAQGNYQIGGEAQQYQSGEAQAASGLPAPLQKKKEEHKEY